MESLPKAEEIREEILELSILSSLIEDWKGSEVLTDSEIESTQIHISLRIQFLEGQLDALSLIGF